jgi:hypothetical protein
MGWFGLVWNVCVGLVMVCVVGSVVVFVSGCHPFPLFLVLCSGLRLLSSSSSTLFLPFLSFLPGVWYGRMGCGSLFSFLVSSLIFRRCLGRVRAYLCVHYPVVGVYGVG